MKKISMPVLVLISLLSGTNLFSQGVGIGATSFTPNSSAGLQLKFPDKGLLVPQVDLGTSLTTLETGAHGLMVYNTNNGIFSGQGLYINNSTTAVPDWIKVSTNISGTGSGNTIAFWSSPTELSHNSNLNWDNTNSRLGIGTSAPSQQLTITGNFEIPVTTSSDAGIIFKSGNRYIHDFGSYNNFIGVAAGNFAMTGTSNVGFGDEVLKSLSSGSSNTAVGDYSMVFNTSGGRNIAVGASALEQNVSGTSNIAIGASAMNHNTLCSQNIAIGDGALQAGALSPGNYGTKNTAIGYEALYNTSPGSETNGRDNIGIGYNVLRENTIGANNTAVGNYACRSTNGYNNTAFGMEALVVNQTGSNNVAVGYKALYHNFSGSGNIAIGNYCGVSQATPGLSNTIVIANNMQANQNNMIILGDGTNNAFWCYAVYNATTPGVYDININQNGQLMRVSSSKRYITDITDLEINTAGIYRLRPVPLPGLTITSGILA